MFNFIIKDKEKIVERFGDINVIQSYYVEYNNRRFPHAYKWNFTKDYDWWNELIPETNEYEKMTDKNYISVL